MLNYAGSIFSRVRKGFFAICRDVDLCTIFAFSFFFLTFLWMYMTLDTVFAPDDHFFHFRFAEQLRHNGVFNSFLNFKTIYFTKMAQGNEYFIYYNFLYYLVIIPFTYITPLFLGLKLYAVFAASLSFTILYWVIKKLEIKFAFVWTIALFGAFASNYILRFFSARPYTLAPAFLLLLLYFLHTKKYKVVFVVSFLYIFWHSATFFLPVLIASTYFVFEKFYDEKGNSKNLYASMMGVGLSLGLVCLLTPGFSLYLKDMMADVISGALDISIFGHSVSIQEGQELYPSDFFVFVRRNYIAFFILVICIVVFLYKYVMLKVQKANVATSVFSSKIESRRVITASAFLLTILFFFCTVAISARFGDYFIFLGSLFIAIYLDEILLFISISSEEISRAIKIGIVLSVCYLFVSNILLIRQTISLGVSVEKTRSLGDWLTKNVKNGEVIFNTNWGLFPLLYYHSPNLNYVVGIEPRFLYTYDRTLYFEWDSIITKGYLCKKDNCDDKKIPTGGSDLVMTRQEKWYKDNGEEVAEAIINDFKSHIIISTEGNPKFNDLMDKNKRFTKRFSTTLNPKIYIYEIK